MMDLNKIQYLYDYDSFLKDRDKKVVRNPRSNTLVDFITDEEIIKIKGKDKVVNYSEYDPSPKYIIDFIDFSVKVLVELLNKYPNDEFLRKSYSEEYKAIFASSNWFEQYGYKYPYCEDFNKS